MTKAQKIKKRKVGRPATGHGKTIGVRCHDDLLERIKNWQKRNRSKSPSEAIRALVEIGLEHDTD